MRHILTFIIALCYSYVTLADNRLQEAEEAYSTAQYATAANVLTQVADSLEQAGITPNADIYYNLGNAHYRQQRYAEASLYYLRALRIRPDFEHATGNLQKAQLHLGLQNIENDDMFFVLWFRMLVNAFSVEGWTSLAIVFFLIVFAALAGYILPKRIGVRKAGFTVAMLVLLCAIFSIACAATQRYRYRHNAQAVIFSPETALHTSPTPNSRVVSTLREGQIVVILNDETKKGWLHVRLPQSSTVGWMTKKGFKRVVTENKKTPKTEKSK